MQDKRIYVAGHSGMVGSALVRALQSRGCENVLTQSSSQLDLRDQLATSSFFAEEKPDLVLFAAARVGGIHANNTYPAQFIYDNLMMATNAIQAAYEHGTQRFLFLGSTCIYPRMAQQPMQESCLLTSPLEKTNEAYALAKIAGLKMCQFYRRQYGVLFHSAMPTNLYGPGDNYHAENSHVVPALIRRFHEAKVQDLSSVTIWGTGKPRREFLHVDDLAEGALHLAQLDSPPDWVNLGTGTDVSILEVAEMIAEVVGFKGQVLTDSNRPDGTPVKRTDTTLLSSTGWSAETSLEDGLRSTYAAYLAEFESGTLRV